ncbi:threonine-phosphate decarboxylase CobD [Phaeovulum sp. NW3]|uniref:threonine-phosphate decarboxylase CobD n=1 Tax=Phaeovulum sp. NW3 TaxID=2934933 RepID=UPI002021E46E|nr:threonine-phosphate decarboxylase CobD [Phaeovulum sp. NW3]MCL7466156.1 threonine-phosphate decarboxylase CobD [Phaeovulum sp. NW3]
MRDHGGNIDWARARYGGTDWVDLSTGINRCPWPVPDLPRAAWTDLPTASAKAALMAAARAAFGTDAPGLALAGAQAAIQMLPRLGPVGRARVLAPTYNEHAANLRAAGWQVQEVGELADLAGADLAVVVNPNNPDGRRHAPDALRALAGQVGRLVVDESFADADPDLSLIAAAGAVPGLVVLRSFGKFWGLAGLRLGFAFAEADTVARLEEMAGPWPVCGAALEIGRLALADDAWRRATIARLAQEAVQIDALAAAAGWALVGGTALFRTYDTPDAAAAQDRLARHRIWSRIFPYSPRWIRLGLPGSTAEWDLLARALATP